MKIDRAELLRYLGWRGQPLDGVTSDSLERMSARCLEVAAPRSVVRRFAYANGALSETGVKLEGADIAKHLSGVDEVYLIAATVGAGIERELTRLTAVSRTDALVFDAAASCAIESYLDERCAELEKLNTPTRIGVCVDENYTLSPLKSVTAVIGILKEGAKRGACASRCAICTKTDCVYRR